MNIIRKYWIDPDGKAWPFIDETGAEVWSRKDESDIPVVETKPVVERLRAITECNSVRASVLINILIEELEKQK